MDQKLKANQKKPWLFTGQASSKGTVSSDHSEPIPYQKHSFGTNVPKLYEKGQFQRPRVKAYEKLH